jgi:alpha-amylase/alpha-mannosidase (GH57 family)
VVNFVPVLLDQIEDYVRSSTPGEFRDPLLRLLARDRSTASARTNAAAGHLPAGQPRHAWWRPTRATSGCTRSLPRGRRPGRGRTRYLSGAFFADLLVWYHLVWTGETERRRNPLLAELMSQGRGLHARDRRRCWTADGELMRGLVPRYRALAERGQVELSATPDTHPLAPLLLDFASARESPARHAAAAVALLSRRPGSRVDRHIALARDSHARRFGAGAGGMWPAEGAVSDAFDQQLAAQGCRWAASSQGVLANSLRRKVNVDASVSRTTIPWRLAGGARLALFFRDERLSDLIGFEYAKWHGRDAAQHFVDQLAPSATPRPAGETPAGLRHARRRKRLGALSLQRLLLLRGPLRPARRPALARHHHLRRLAGCGRGPPLAEPAGLVAGSWVYGTFSTWIGEAGQEPRLGPALRGQAGV